MRKNLGRTRCSQRPTWAIGLFAVAFFFCLPVEAQTQNNVTTPVPPGGTINKIPKWTAGTALGDSVITESSGNIGIGTTSPSYKLHIEGATGQTLKLGTTNLINNGMLGEILFTNQNGGVASAIQAWNPNTVWQDFTDLRFFTSSTWSNLKAERMRIDFNGNVGIGTTAPAQLVELFQNTNGNVRLQVTNPNPGSFSSAGFRLSAGNTASADAIIWKSSNAVTGYGGVDSLNIYQRGNFPIALLTNDAVRLFVKGDGNVGIGTTTPIYKLEVAGSTNIKGGQLLLGPSTAALDASIEVGGNGSGNRYGFIDIVTDGTYTDYGLRLIRDNTGPNANSQLWHRGTGNLYLGAIEAGQVILRTNNADRMTIDSQGKVGIGTTPSPQYALDAGGNVNASGTISGGNIVAKYQDVAEWVPSSRAIAAGTVVVLDAERSNHVLASSRAYDTRVAGVVSSKPGVLLGEGGVGKVMVATTGRMSEGRCDQRSDSSGRLAGHKRQRRHRDALTAARSGRDSEIHRPGTLIGKALEPLDKV